MQNKNKWSDKTEWQWNVDLTKKCKSIRSKPIVEIDDDDIGKILSPIWLTRVESADRLLRRLNAVFNDAIADRVINRNPADKNVLLRHHLPDRGKRVQRHHPSIPYPEIPAFLAALRTKDNLSSRAIELVCLTVLRSNELRGGR